MARLAHFPGMQSAGQTTRVRATSGPTRSAWTPRSPEAFGCAAPTRVTCAQRTSVSVSIAPAASATITDRGVTPTPAPYGITIVSGGNPLLDPEKADTYTVGIVYAAVGAGPRHVDRLAQRVARGRHREPHGAANRRRLLCQGRHRPVRNIHRDPVRTASRSSTRCTRTSRRRRSSGVDAEIGYTRAINLLRRKRTLRRAAVRSWISENSRTNSLGRQDGPGGQHSPAAPRVEGLDDAQLHERTVHLDRSRRATSVMACSTRPTTYRTPRPACDVLNVADNTIGSVGVLRFPPGVRISRLAWARWRSSPTSTTCSIGIRRW